MSRTFDAPYADFGKCELCSAEVPPTGAFIGFFGKTDYYPRWCRACVVKDGDMELLVAFDEAVGAERVRRESRQDAAK